MLLQVINPTKYISPSSFMEWRNCQYQFYQGRLAGHPYVPRKISMHAQIGSAFDAYIKIFLNETLELGKPFKLKNFLEGIDSQAVEIGHQIFEWYINCNYHRQLIEAHKVNIDVKKMNVVGNTPLYGILDASLDGKYPFDWKIRFGYHTRGFKWNSKDHITDRIRPLENDSEYWAIQMLMYSWILENPVVQRHYAHIAEIDVGKLNNTQSTIHPTIYIHDRFISEEFAEKIWSEINEMWNKINDLEIELDDPIPHKNRCEKFGTVCHVADLCNPYMRTLGDPDRRINYV